MSYPTVLGRAVEGVPYREAQSCLGPAFAVSTYKFFVTGTNTPANVYQNGTLTTAFPITGQVTSDNYGRFPPIYLDTSVIYRVQFYDKTNVLRWQVDPYTPPLSTVGTSSLSTHGINISTTGEVTIPAPSTGGSGVSLTLDSGVLGTAALRVSATLPGNSALIVNNSATTGTQATNFTATNKPGTATSSPAGWLPITCDGVQYYTPIWHGNSFTPYLAAPSALGEIINASSVTFTGSGLTTATNGTAMPGNWYSPTSAGIGSGYYINITKTSGLSAVAFSAAQGSWVNITSSGLTISSNAQSPITGTYQLSTSVTGSPVVASGTITLSNNNGVQSPTYTGAVPFVLNGGGTATFNSISTYNWYTPTTASIGASYYIKIMQTGGTSGCTFSAATSGYTNIGSGGLSIGINGGVGTSYNVTGSYIIASDSGGVNQLGSGTITLTGGSSVQSPNYSGTTPLILNGNGSATLNGSSTSDWFTPNIANSGSGYWIDITRTGGTAGVNFTAAQGSWTNITNSGLTINMSGYTGDIGTVTVTGTYQISSSSSGSPVLGSGSISLSVNAGSLVRTYTTGTSATETVPTGASTCVVEVFGGGGGGGCSGSSFGAGGGGSGGYSRTSLSVTSGNTMIYTVGTGGAGKAVPGTGSVGTASSVSSGTQTITTLTGNGGAGGQGGGTGGSGGSASGGTVVNTTGNTGNSNSGAAGGAGGAGIVGVNGTGNAGGAGGAGSAGAGSNGGSGKIVFTYS